MRKDAPFGLLVLSFWFGGPAWAASSPAELEACAKLVERGFRPIAEDRADRFLGKVTKDAALCRGGEKAVRFPGTPWVDWSSYWATGDESTRADGREARTVVLKLKTSDFNILTRSHTPLVPPASCAELTAIALSLRDRIDLGPARRFRLVGVGLSNFREIDQLQAPLFE